MNFVEVFGPPGVRWLFPLWDLREYDSVDHFYWPPLEGEGGRGQHQRLPTTPNAEDEHTLEMGPDVEMSALDNGSPEEEGEAVDEEEPLALGQ